MEVGPGTDPMRSLSVELILLSLFLFFISSHFRLISEREFSSNCSRFNFSHVASVPERNSTYISAVCD